MRTKKAISTISYNTQEFLVEKLNELIESHTISDYMFINHFAEKDETKNHIHLYIQPNILIDTMYLQDFFKEIDLENPTKKPLKCIDFRLSQSDEWILYCQHYAPYLATKLESREYHYKKDDFVFYDEDNFDYLYNHAFKGSKFAQQNQLLDVIFGLDVSPVELIKMGAVPINLASQLNAMEFMKRNYYQLNRNNRPNHEQYNDEIDINSIDEIKQIE